MKRLVLILATIVGIQSSPASRGEPQSQPGQLTIDRLYSLPSLIGTAPRSFAWSRDSRRVGFLWNDEGANFLDVWIAEAADAEPRRVTRMQRPTAPPQSNDIEEVQRAVDVEQHPGVTALAWHPDNRRLVFTFENGVHIVSPGEQPRRLPDPDGAETDLAFSADGAWLAFLNGGDIWLLDGGLEEAAAPRRLTSIATASVAVERMTWAPRGHRLVLVEIDRSGVPIRGIPDYLTPETALREVYRPYPGEASPSRRIGFVDASSGGIDWIDRGGDPLDPIFSVRWSPDGTRLLVDTSDLYVKDRRVLVVDAQTKQVAVFYRETNPLNVTAAWAAEWAPDGRGIYIIADRDEDYHIYLVPGPGAVPRRITSGPWAVAGIEVSAAAKAIFFEANEGNPEERHLYRVPLDGGEIARISQRPGTHSALTSPDGRFAAVHFSSDTTPPDLYLIRLDAGGQSDAERRVTTSPPPEFEQYRWAKPTYVTFKSHVDGVTLHGRLTLPPDLDKSKRYPAILGSVYSNTVRNQWGGRTAHPTWGFDQFLLQEGYVLLNVDIRGSWGHGKAFRQGIRLDYGGIDTEDLYSGVLFLKTLGFVDMERVGIWGSSYGGLLTCMSLFKKPGVYKAGVAAAPATNVWHANTGEMRVMMRPQDHPREYDAASAYTFAAGLEDHLMLLHGMRDRIVLFKDSVVLTQRLMLLGKDVDTVILPDAVHGWDTQGLYQTRFAFHKMVQFFDRHLGRGPG